VVLLLGTFWSLWPIRKAVYFSGLAVLAAAPSSATTPNLPNPLRSVPGGPKPAGDAGFLAETCVLARGAESANSFSPGRYSPNLWSLAI
jgi:hypothetical protein